MSKTHYEQAKRMIELNGGCSEWVCSECFLCKDGICGESNSIDAAMKKAKKYIEQYELAVFKNDGCRTCTAFGNFEICSVTPCSVHESWYVSELKKRMRS